MGSFWTWAQCPASLAWGCGAAELVDVTSLSGLFLVLCSQAGGWTAPRFLPLPVCKTSCPAAMALGYQLCPVCSGTNKSWFCCHLLFCVGEVQSHWLSLSRCPPSFIGLCLFSPGLPCLFTALLSWILGFPASGHVQVPLHPNETGGDHHILVGRQSLCGPWVPGQSGEAQNLPSCHSPDHHSGYQRPWGCCVLAGLKALGSVPHH